MELAVFPLTSLPGIQRDGTGFSSRSYRDGQHCRWDATDEEKGTALPRKMGGYRQIITINQIPRGIFVTPSKANPDKYNVYVGTPNNLYYFLMDNFGVAISGLIDVTPVGFVASPDNIWQFQIMYSSVGANATIIAYAGPNLQSIDQFNERQVYYAPLDSGVPFIAIPAAKTQVSGGIVELSPYLFIFGNNGELQWSAPNNPASFPPENINNFGGLKIVAGIPTRGGNSAPAGIFWALDRVFRATFVGEPGDFKFDTLATGSSLLSSSSIVDDDGIIYWVGLKNFCVYNGTVKKLRNNMNRQYFFRNLNRSEFQKVWGTKIPQWSEIWWFYPAGTSTECNRAVIFNTRLNKWYDTSLDRVSGYIPSVFEDPIWASSTPNEEGNYIIWQHEVGVDQNIEGILTPIESYFETGDIAWCSYGPPGEWTGKDRWVDLQRFEPDFIQVGNLALTIKGRQYARSLATSNVSNPYNFTALTEKIDMREQAREMTLKVVSNELGGFYYMGNCLVHFRLGDARS